METFLRAVLAVAVVVSSSAWASSGGITGRSGKQGSSCNGCHSGGGAPTVAFDGPTELATGEVGTYTFTITGGAAVKAGFNVAVSGTSAVLTAGTNQKKTGSELTHTAPVSFSGGNVTFTFTMKAPTAPGTVTLYGAGNSVNGTGTDSGDRGAITNYPVTVVAVDGGVPPVDAGMEEPDAGMEEPDAGSMEEPDAGAMDEDAGTTNPNPDGTGDGDGTPPPSDEEEPQGGCAAAGVALAPFLLGAWVIHLRRRSRKES
jgi:hypothetical protein